MFDEKQYRLNRQHNERLLQEAEQERLARRAQHHGQNILKSGRRVAHLLRSIALFL